MSLGSAIRTIRQLAFLTQEDFAKELSVALCTVNRWELDRSKPNMKAMRAIKAFCDSNNLPYELIEAEWLPK